MRNEAYEKTKVIDDMRRFNVVPRWLLLFGREPVGYRPLMESGFTGQFIFHEAEQFGYLELCRIDEIWASYKITQKAIDYFMEGKEDGV